MGEVTCCGCCEHRDFFEDEQGVLRIRCRMWMQAAWQPCRDSCDGQVREPCVPWCVSSGTLEKYKAMRPEREKENHECKD